IFFETENEAVIDERTEADDLNCSSSSENQQSSTSDQSESELYNDKFNPSVEEKIKCIDFKLKNLNLNPAKIRSLVYEKESLTEPKCSDETELAFKQALSKHENPTQCPICKKMFKNDKGVKLHKSKMH
ncbi:hypothetical protein BpHYR1_006642, partial [Brachionus plicatilis]